MVPTYKTILVLLLALTSWIAAGADSAESAVTLGKKVSLDSKVLNQAVPLSIHLPEDFDTSDKQYPVLFMMGSSYRARFAMLASTLDYMADKQVPGMVLVGVDLPNGNRVLLPDSGTGATDKPDAYIQFFETELLPFVEEQYRAASFRMLFGASNSGWFTTYTLLKKPELFHSYLASSPSLGRVPQLLEKLVKEGPMKQVSGNRSLHIIYSDDDFNSVKNFVPEFSRVFAEHKPESLTFKVDALVNQGHVPATDFTSFLLAQYPDFNPLETLDSLSKIQNHFNGLSKRYGYPMLPPLSMVYDLGIDQALDKKLVEAEQVFDYAMTVYPKEKKTYIGMGVVHRERGDKQQATAMFNKALAIDPDYSLAKRLLARLEE